MIYPVGESVVTVTYKNTTRTLKLYIVDQDYANIMGRDWIEKLNVLDISNINLVHNSPEITNILENYSEVFEEKIQPVEGVKISVKLKPNATPIFSKARVVPYALRSKVQDEIQRMEEEGILFKTQTSDWATPVVPVVKPDGSIRLCADYSVTVNPQMIIPQYPFPGFDAVSAKLVGGSYFSKLDVKTAFLHLPVTEDASEILTINTHMGLYKVKRLLYGLASAPAEWQRFIDNVFQDIPGVCVVHDDIIITGSSINEHNERLELVLQKLKLDNVRLNKSKCKYLQKEIKYLGFILSEAGVGKTQETVEAILKCKRPTNVSEVKSFMGLVTFYARFTPNLATLAEPLHQLTRGSKPFIWKKQHSESFRKIKHEITSERILVHYNPQLPLVLAVDASQTGLGAVLAHDINGDERPIAFASRTLSKSERNYSQIDKEALAIKWGVEKFYHYLYGQHFTLITDHLPLTRILGEKNSLPVITATRLLRYALFLQMFNFTIKYRKSAENSNADCMSRLSLDAIHKGDTSDDSEVFQLSQLATLPITSPEIAKGTLQDPDLREILRKLQNGISVGDNDKRFTLQHNCIFFGIRVYIPKKFRNRILEELHMGHVGIVKMKALARSHVYWPGIDKSIEEHVKHCTPCLLVSREPSKVTNHHWQASSTPWERIHIDHMGPFFGKYFLLVIDSYSKWPEIFIVDSTSSSKTIAVLDSLFARYGYPVILVSDNGTAFTSREFRDFTNKCGIRHVTCAPYNPSTNGQVERYVYTTKQALRSLTKERNGNLQQNLNTFLFSYRRSPSASGECPAKLFLGRNIQSALTILQRPNRNMKYEPPNLQPAQIFQEREKVAVRNYASPNNKWMIGTVINRDGQLHYTVNVDGQLWRRHAQQIRKVGQHVLIVPPLTYTRDKTEEQSHQLPEPSVGPSSSMNGAPTTPPTPSLPISTPTKTPPPYPSGSSITDNYSAPATSSPGHSSAMAQQVPIEARRSMRMRKPVERLDL